MSKTQTGNEHYSVYTGTKRFRCSCGVGFDSGEEIAEHIRARTA